MAPAKKKHRRLFCPFLQCLIDGKYLVHVLICADQRFYVVRAARGGSAAFLAATGARPVYQNPAHYARRERQEMIAIRDVQRFGAAEPKISFVHQRRRTQALRGRLCAKTVRGNTVQFAIQRRTEHFPRPYRPAANWKSVSRCRLHLPCRDDLLRPLQLLNAVLFGTHFAL